MARVRATQDYLIKCDNIFIVAKISRAITDQSLKSSLFWVISRHVPMEWEESGGKNFKLAVVCTKSEVLTTFAFPHNNGLTYQSGNQSTNGENRILWS